MLNEPIDEELYYFVFEHQGRYYPLFFSWIAPEMVADFSEIKGDKMFLHMEVETPCHKFSCNISKPLFMFNIQQDVSAFVGDNEVLDNCPTGDCEDGLPRFLPYPTFFKSEVSSIFEYKLDRGLFKQIDGIWQPVNI